MFEFKSTGICLTDANKTVLFQNNVYEQICGKHTSKVCNICQDFVYSNKQLYPTGDFSELTSELVFCKRQEFPDFTCDIYKHIEKNHKELTILVPVNKVFNQYLQLLTNKKLTSREIEVATLILEHKSNIEIQNALFISKSTLKTHLNHIYSKFPPLKTFRLNHKKSTP